MVLPLASEDSHHCTPSARSRASTNSSAAKRIRSGTPSLLATSYLSAASENVFERDLLSLRQTA